MKIITVTLNPAYDVYYTIENFKPYSENLISRSLVSIGGKGINVSRALKANGIASHAFILMGKENSQAFVNQLNAEEIDCDVIFCDGRIRENITVLSPGIPETRICMNNFTAAPEVMSAVLAELKKKSDQDTVIVYSGKFPKNISISAASDFIKELLLITPYVSLDSNTFALKDIVDIKPWLIKPNGEEIEAFTGEPVPDAETAANVAERLCALGVKNVLISLGGDGAAYCGELGKCTVNVPKISPLSTIGAGDSTVAGFISAYTEGKDMTECLSRACAYGTAACLEEGTMPPLPEKIEAVLASVSVNKL